MFLVQGQPLTRPITRESLSTLLSPFTALSRRWCHNINPPLAVLTSTVYVLDSLQLSGDIRRGARGVGEGEGRGGGRDPGEHSY